VPLVGGIIVEATEMHAMPLREVAQVMPRPDIVPLVGRIRHAMAQKR
jgi:hypothetical protein